MPGCMVDLQIQSNLRKKKLHKTNQGSNFSNFSSGNRNSVSAPTQLRRESQAKHLKRCFFLKNRPIFTSIAPVLLDQTNKASLVFPALKSTSHFLPQSTVYCRSYSSLEANSSCCHRSDV